MKKIIAIDVGNSETTVGVGNSDNWESYRYTTRKTVTSDELLMMFKTTIDLSKADDELLHGAIVCSVVPQITDSVVSAINKFSSKEVLVVGPGIKTGLKVNIDNPKELGPDRIANSVGGYKKINKEVIIVDLGTATTFDVLIKHTYSGGIIAPGVRLSLNTLSDKATLIPKIDLKKVKNVIGNDTISAVRSGFFWGYSGLIDNIINLIKKETNKSFKIIITGGFSSLFKNSIKTKVTLNKDITIKGLIKLANLNK